jgi:two-component system phosphate regulon response regulator PhoB
MSTEKILIVEDEEDIQELISYNLGREGYDTKVAGSGEEGLRLLKEYRPGLIVLDLMLPGMDGLEFCRFVKRDPRTEGIPVVMVTAKGEESDIVTGLELGADDYVTKPFSPKVLVARVRTVLRRGAEPGLADRDVISAHDIEIHAGRHEVRVGGSPVELTLSEFKILRFLASRPGWVFTRYQIVDAVKGEDYAVTERSVDVQIVGLRKKLGAAGPNIETVRGVGYRFKE